MRVAQSPGVVQHHPSLVLHAAFLSFAGLFWCTRTGRCLSAQSQVPTDHFIPNIVVVRGGERERGVGPFGTSLPH